MEYISEKIIPAVMPKSFQHLKDEMKRFASLVPLVQIDVMDGNLTPSKSWPYQSGQVDSEFLKIVNQEEGFPCWEDLDVEVDLMVTNPAQAADQWIATGAMRIVVHFESETSDVISSVLASIKEKGIEAALAVGLETPIETVLDFYDKNGESIDVVQFMGIEKIGFQGQSFDERVIQNITAFKERFPEAMVSVDGGVNGETVSKLADAKVNRLIVGSALSNGDSVEETIQSFDEFLS